MMDGYGMTTWGWIFMVVLWVAIIAIIVIVALRVLRPGDDRSPAAPRPVDALEVLDQRYARGEIDTDEYLLRRRTLAGDRHEMR